MVEHMLLLLWMCPAGRTSLTWLQATRTGESCA
jgi:hypothetical protein